MLVSWQHLESLFPKSDNMSIVIPLSAYNLTIPVFYGATLQDYVNLPSLNIPGMQAACSNLVVHNFNTTHWPQFEVPNEVNQALGSWVASLN